MDSGHLVRAARRRRSLHQAELARRAGTTQTYVSRVERGAVAPSVTTVERLLNAMGLRLRLDVEELPHGNVSAAELRADLVELSAEERVEQAMNLSRYLTELAAGDDRSR